MTKETVETIKFNADDVKMSRKIVANYLKYDTEDDVDPEAPSFYSVPNNIAFFFQASKRDMDSKTFAHHKFSEDDLKDDFDNFQQKPSFAVFMYPKFERYSECEMIYLLETLLPDYLGEISECTFCLELDDEKVSAYDVFKDLVNKGFVYKSAECDLKDYFSKIKIVNKGLD